MNDRIIYGIDVKVNFEASQSLEPILMASSLRSPAITTLHARLALPKTLPHTILQQCLIDSTASPINNNSTLATHGNHVIGYYVTDWIMTKYPRLPFPVLKNTLISYAGWKSLAEVGKGWGVNAAETESTSDATITFKSVPAGQTKETSEGTYKTEAYANFVRSLIGALHIHTDHTTTRQFVDNHILSRHLDLLRSFRIEQPGRQLSFLCAREGLETPSTRLVAETGRRTNDPVYIQAVYTGEEKLGEGQGSSLREAKFNAEQNAMKAWCLFEDRQADLSSHQLEGTTRLRGYKPAMIDSGDIIV